jgi:signal transduction histidine kinase
MKAPLREILAEIELEADRLADLVESLLEAGRTKDLDARNADLAFTRPATIIDVSVNVSQMERVLANLLQNAIKYTPSDTPN